jgi:transcriptional regulator with XRE-family HTH domain
MDDRRLGLVIRALRRRRNWRQADLASAAGCSQSLIARAEAGHLDTLAVRMLRSILAALDARLELGPRWRGGDLDRLLDSRHSAAALPASNLLVASGWTSLQEVTYAVYGERGSIDVLGLREDVAAAFVGEVKSVITSWEETQRKFDEKVRLLPKIVHERFGWRPRIVARVLIVEGTPTNRRRIAALGATVDQLYPLRSREVRAWVGNPTGNVAGIWFVSPRTGGGISKGRGGNCRVRCPRNGV